MVQVIIRTSKVNLENVKCEGTIMDLPYQLERYSERGSFKMKDAKHCQNNSEFVVIEYRYDEQSDSFQKSRLVFCCSVDCYVEIRITSHRARSYNQWGPNATGVLNVKRLVKEILRVGNPGLVIHGVGAVLFDPAVPQHVQFVKDSINRMRKRPYRYGFPEDALGNHWKDEYIRRMEVLLSSIEEEE